MDQPGFQRACRNRASSRLLWLALVIVGAAMPAVRADSLPSEDRLACEKGMPARAAAALEYPVDAGFWDDEWHTACRLDPSHPDRAIVALTYRKGEEQTGESAEPDYDTRYDLDVVVMDIVDGTIVAHRHEPEAIMSDAIRYEDVRIDTARYQLAPGKRAFGIRTSHSSHCYQCAYAYTDLTLYLQDGDRLDAVLATQVAETTNASDDDCPEAIIESNTTVGVGSHRSHGLADLLLTTTVKGDANAEGGSSSVCAMEQTSTVTAHFDGHVYQLPKALHRVDDAR